MSEESVKQEIEPQSFSDREASVNVILRPSRATFARIAEDPKATSKRAYGWVFGGVAIAFGMTLGFVGFNGEGLTAATLLATLTFVLFALDTATSHWLAKVFGGEGSYSRLAYAVAAYYRSLIPLVALLDGIPYLGYLNILVILYGAYLKVLAVAGTYQFNWKKAGVAAFALPLGLGLLLLFYLLGTVLGATIIHFLFMSMDDPGPYIIGDAIGIGMMFCGPLIAIIGAIFLLIHFYRRIKLYTRYRG